MRPRRRPGGNILLMALAVTLILLTIVLALHYQEVLSHRSVTTAEGDLEARQLARYLMGRKVGMTQGTPPAWLVAGSDVEDDDRRTLPTGFGARVFGTPGLPDLLTEEKTQFDSAVPAAVSHEYLRMTPRSGASGLGFGIPQYLGAVGQESMVAAAAPRGSVKADSVLGWSNPADGAGAPSGVPAVVSAQGAVDIGSFPYGEAWSLEGDIRPGRGAWGALGSEGVGPMAEPDATGSTAVHELVRQAESARLKLQEAASGNDKTELLIKQPPGAAQVYNAITSSGSLPSFLNAISLRQALRFPMPTLPYAQPLVAFKALEIYEINFEASYSPDGNGADWADKAQEIMRKFIEAFNELDKAVAGVQTAIDKVREARDSLDRAIRSCDSWPAAFRWICQSGVAVAKLALYAAEGVLVAAKWVLQLAINMVKRFVTILLAPFTTAIAFTGTKDPPADRAAEDALKATEEISIYGRRYWAYKDILLKVLNTTELVTKFLESLFKGSFEPIARSMANDVSLVWVGQSGRLDGVALGDNNLRWPTTLNVPRARTLTVRGNLTIVGDLWLQRGSCMAVRGDLSIVAPTGGTGLLRPQGRLILEEGATLSVDGNFTCEGTRESGAVLCVSPLLGSRPLTSAILARGDVTVKNSIVPAFAWDDPAMAGPTPREFLLNPLLEGAAPNLAKTAGPFRPRLPYISRYETTFQALVMPELGLVVVIPGPAQRQSVMALIFRGLALAHAPPLNFTLGENLVTQCDWWFGQGVVPASVKPTGDVLIRGASSLAPASGTLPASFTASLNGYAALASADARSAVLDDIVKRIQQLYIQMAAAWIKSIAFDFLPPGVPLLPDDLFRNFQSRLDDRQTQLDAATPNTSALGNSLKTFFQTAAGQTQGGFGAQQLRARASGALVYSGRRLTVGQAGAPATVACGMFLAQGPVDLQASAVVGSAFSRDGSITIGGDLLFYPWFTRASLFVPQKEPQGDWIARGKRADYGAALEDRRADSEKSVEVGRSRPHVTAWGRSR